MKNNNEWIPLTSGKLPEEEVDVQVTYLGYYDGKPYCNEFAYMKEGHWRWSSNDELITYVEITAWKPNCEPYIVENKK